jgi:hypothetical protein
MPAKQLKDIIAAQLLSKIWLVLNATREKKYDGSCRKRCHRKTISAGSVPPKTLAIIAEGPAINNTAAIDDLTD